MSLSTLSDDEVTRLRGFLETHKDTPPARLALKYSGDSSLPPDFLDIAICQIECRKRCRTKLKNTLAENPGFLFPSLLSSEQCTDEKVSKYHSGQISANDSVLDMTSGLGIDAMGLATKAKSVTAVEYNPKTADYLKHNTADKANIEVICADSVEYLNGTERRFDVIFADPARRDNVGNRTYAFADCQPDIPAHLPLIMSKCNKLIIKASPMLDITEVQKELLGIAAIEAINLRGECKELLITINKDLPPDFKPVLRATEINSDGDAKTFVIDHADYLADITYISDNELNGGVYRYLYEPSASVMKFAPWRELANKFPEIRKAGRNTHLFFSNNLIADFPGRIVEIGKVTTLKDKGLKGLKTNIVCRNCPLKPEEVKRRLKASDTETDDFLYCFRSGPKETVTVVTGRKTGC